jgi:hypothetical protein
MMIDNRNLTGRRWILALTGPLSPLLASLDVLHGALDGDVGRRRLATIGDHFPVALDGERSGFFLASGVLAARLNNSSVVYLKKSFNAQKGGVGCTLRVLLPNAFDPGPLGKQPCSFRLLCPLGRGFRARLFSCTLMYP